MRGARATALLASPMGSEGTWLSELQTGNGHSWGALPAVWPQPVHSPLPPGSVSLHHGVMEHMRFG